MLKFRVLHFFCGIGGKALGFAYASAAHGDVTASFETIGGIDADELACRDFETLTGAPALCADIHELEPCDLLRFAGPTAPDVVAMSPPCKGLSGLLSERKAQEPKYQRMNTLMHRALLLVSSTWPTPPKLIFVENVPRMESRGRDVVAKSRAILEAHGYAIATGSHDCGELGGLAQHRHRWFLLARHIAQVPQCVYEPRKHRVRACGEVLGPLPMPGDVANGGPMHTVPNLSWRNWLRLGMIPAGGDWRDLPGTLADGQQRREVFRRDPVTAWEQPADTVTGPGGSASTNVADPRVGMTCAPRAGAYGVLGFDAPSDTITGAHGIDNARAAVADPRIALGPSDVRHWNKYAVSSWEEPAQTVIGAVQVGSGAPSVADPRARGWFPSAYRVTGWDDTAPTVTSGGHPSTGAGVVADPRWGGGRLGVTRWDEPSGVVAGESLPNNGKYSVADPRFVDGKRKNWQQVAGVTPWTEPSPTITSGADLHAGAFQVADPRVLARPEYRIMTLAEALALDLDPDKPVPWIPVIVAADGTWHRPMTTLELGVLQSLPPTIDGKPLVLATRTGSRGSHTSWRERIGNCVPPLAALGVGEQLLQALVVAALGSFALSNDPIWVAPNEAAH